MYTIVHIDEAKLTDQHWKDFYDLRLALHNQYGSPLRQDSWLNVKKQILAYIKAEENAKIFFIYQNENMVGWSDFRVQQTGTPDQVVTIYFNALYDVIPEEFAIE